MEVPSDVVLEILSRVPVDKAAKIQSLSKFHAKASYCSYYKDLVAQNQLQPFLDGFLLQSYGSKKYLSFVSPQLNSFPPLDVSLSFFRVVTLKFKPLPQMVFFYVIVDTQSVANNIFTPFVNFPQNNGKVFPFQGLVISQKTLPCTSYVLTLSTSKSFVYPKIKFPLDALCRIHTPYANFLILKLGGGSY